MNQEMIDKMVTGSPLLDPRGAVSVAFRNYERYIAAPLKCVLDRDWKEEDLYAVAQIAANAITYRDREIAALKNTNKVLVKSNVELKDSLAKTSTPRNWEYNLCVPNKPLAISEKDNVPCTATLEVELEKLFRHFEKRAKENTKRASSEDIKVLGSYYFSGKADSYTKAASKLREILGNTKSVETKPEPEHWVVECLIGGRGWWTSSYDYPEVYSSKAEAERQFGNRKQYRAVPLIKHEATESTVLQRGS